MFISARYPVVNSSCEFRPSATPPVRKRRCLRLAGHRLSRAGATAGSAHSRLPAEHWPRPGHDQPRAGRGVDAGSPSTGLSETRSSCKRRRSASLAAPADSRCHNSCSSAIRSSRICGSSITPPRYGYCRVRPERRRGAFLEFGWAASRDHLPTLGSVTRQLTDDRRLRDEIIALRIALRPQIHLETPRNAAHYVPRSLKRSSTTGTSPSRSLNPEPDETRFRMTRRRLATVPA